MNYRTFEKNVKSTLQDAEVYVDVGQLISDIRKTEQKRRPIGWWWLGALPLLSLTAYLYFSAPSVKTPIENTSGNTISYNGRSIASTSISTTNDPTSLHHTTSVFSASPNRESDKRPLNFATNFSATENINTTQQKIDANTTSAENRNLNAGTGISRTLLQFPGLNPGLIYLSLNKPETKISREIECPTFRKRTSMSVSLIPEVGYFRPLKTLAQNGSEPSEVFSLREKDEKSLEGIQAALYLKINKSSSPWGLKSGIQLTRLTERMNLSYSYIRRDTTQGIISVTVSQTGDTITTIYGDIISETRVTGTNKAHHSLSTIDIPLALTYEKNFGGFVLGADAGVYFNIALRSGGKILSSANGFSDVKSTNAFRSSLGLSYFGSLFVKKPLGKIGSVYLAARGRYLPGSFTNSNYPVQQSYHMAGLHLGYEFTF